MRVLCYDCFSGISGDMNLGAMLDLGIEESYLKSELDKLNLRGWEIKVEKAQRHGIHGTKVTVKQTMHEHAHRHLSGIPHYTFGFAGKKVNDFPLALIAPLGPDYNDVHGYLLWTS